MEVIKLINEMNEVGFLSSIIVIILLAVSARAIYEFGEWIVGLLNKYHKKVDKDENTQETLQSLAANINLQNERIKNLECQVSNADFSKKIEQLENCAVERAEKLDQLSASVAALVKSFDGFQQDTKEAMSATIKAELYRLHSEAKMKGYITQASAESFSALSGKYLGWKNNSVFKNKIIPDYMSMPMKDVDSVTISETRDMMEDICSKLREENICVERHKDGVEAES